MSPLIAVREQGTEPAQQRRQSDFDRTGEDGHREHGRKPARIGREYGGTDVDR